MLITPPRDVLERDAAGNYVWLTVGELVPQVKKDGPKKVREASVIRKIERWCADDDVLGPYACKATLEQIARLVAAGRIKDYPSKAKGVYLIHRDGLANIDSRPRPGPRIGSQQSRKGKRTGVGILPEQAG